MASGHRSRLTPWLVLVALLPVLLFLEWRDGEAIAATDPNGGTRVVAILRQSRRVVGDTELTHVRMTAVMGGSTLDMRRAKVQAGAEVVVDVLGVMGGLTIRVPDGWVIDTMAVPVFGGVRDERRPSAVVRSASDKPAPRLVLRGAVIMGGLVIES